jgi:hypothetical protein
MMRTMTWVALALAGCGDGLGASPDTADSDADTDADTDSDTDADTDSDTDSDSDADSDTDSDTDSPAPSCEPLAEPNGPVVNVQPGDDLHSLVYDVGPGTTLSLASGTDQPRGSTIWIATEGLTLRSATGNRDDVIIDGEYIDDGGQVIGIAADNVTIADLTIRNPRYHAIHVMGDGNDDTTGTRIYNIHVVDPGEQSIKINSTYGTWADEGEIACSELELTSAGRAVVESQTSSGSHCYTGGIDAHSARDWRVHDNVIHGFWCNGDGETYLSEHGIHFWNGSRDPIIERNVLYDNARAIGLGLTNYSDRSYTDGCGDGTEGHYGGTIRNNFIANSDPALFASGNGADGGIVLWWACGAEVLHNTVAMTDAPYASIEWRAAVSDPVISNNLTTHGMLERDGARGTLAGNEEGASVSWFVDVDGADLHLSGAGSAAVDAGTPSALPDCPEDMDGQVRDATPDQGADEL